MPVFGFTLNFAAGGDYLSEQLLRRTVTVEPSDFTMKVDRGQRPKASGGSPLSRHHRADVPAAPLDAVRSAIRRRRDRPLILDDVTTQSDSARTVAVMELLHELSTERQVILFTQENEVVVKAEKHRDPNRDTIIALPAPGS